MTSRTGVGGTGSKKGHVFKFLWGPPQIEVLLVLTSESKKYLKKNNFSAVGAIFKVVLGRCGKSAKFTTPSLQWVAKSSQLWICHGYLLACMVNTSMTKHYSSDFGVFWVFKGKKTAKNGQKLPKIGPKSALVRNWVFVWIQDILFGYKWLYLAETSMAKHYYSSFGVFRVLQGNKLTKIGPKLLKTNPKSAFTGFWVLRCCIDISQWWWMGEYSWN